MSDTTDDMEHYEVPEHEQLAMAIRDDAIPTPHITAAQAKVDAVASLTMKAYDNASKLDLTEEEITKLRADFPDEAFKPGAAGKDNLIYIEHAFLRERLNDVFTPGKWAIIPRNRWGEDYRTSDGKEATRVYVEAMLVIRGCFVAEAVGDMSYFKSNPSQNYGDCVEGAKTAALRRCAKELGIGLQAWKKDWCEGWWKRRKTGGAPAPKTKPAAKTSDVASSNPTQELATPEQFQKFMLSFNETTRPIAVEYFKKKGWLPNEANAVLEELPIKYAPATKRQYDSIMAELKAYTDGDQSDEDWWKDTEVPFGPQQGTKLGTLPKNKLFGWCMNFEVEESYNGVRKSEDDIAIQKRFREALDAAKEHYEFGKGE